eukprot:444876-Rhodomonas_salina.3
MAKPENTATRTAALKKGVRYLSDGSSAHGALSGTVLDAHGALSGTVLDGRCAAHTEPHVTTRDHTAST